LAQKSCGVAVRALNDCAAEFWTQTLNLLKVPFRAGCAIDSARKHLFPWRRLRLAVLRTLSYWERFGGPKMGFSAHWQAAGKKAACLRCARNLVCTSTFARLIWRASLRSLSPLTADRARRGRSHRHYPRTGRRYLFWRTSHSGRCERRNAPPMRPWYTTGEVEAHRQVCIRTRAEARTGRPGFNRQGQCALHIANFGGGTVTRLGRKSSRACETRTSLCGQCGHAIGARAPAQFDVILTSNMFWRYFERPSGAALGRFRLA